MPLTEEQKAEAMADAITLRNKSKNSLIEGITEFLDRTVEMRMKSVLLFLLCFFIAARVALHFQFVSGEAALILMGAYLTVVVMLVSNILDKITG
jgi:uncharacterized protein (DUF2164 family)